MLKIAENTWDDSRQNPSYDPNPRKNRQIRQKYLGNQSEAGFAHASLGNLSDAGFAHISYTHTLSHTYKNPTSFPMWGRGFSY